jgi:hypothetical protein
MLQNRLAEYRIHRPILVGKRVCIPNYIDIREKTDIQIHQVRVSPAWPPTHRKTKRVWVLVSNRFAERVP